MIVKINKILKDLIGLPLTRTTRAADMECLKFGTLNFINRKGDKCNKGELGLHLQCPWRWTNDKEILVGSNDLYVQVNEVSKYAENFNWDEQNANLRDVKINSLISSRIFIVKFAIADQFGGLQIEFDNNTFLTIFPNITSKGDYEFWRLIDNRVEPTNHYLSTSNGFRL